MPIVSKCRAGPPTNASVILALSLTTNCIYYFCLLIGLSMSAALLCFITVWHLALTYVFNFLSLASGGLSPT